MAANKTVRFGPIAITSSVANVLNPGTTTGGVNMPSGSGNLYFIIKHIRFVNKTAASHTISAWLGATGASAAGTELGFSGTAVPANSYVDWYGLLRLDVADFLTMQADANTSIVFEAEGEVGVAG
jgi:hypothetical protein